MIPPIRSLPTHGMTTPGRDEATGCATTVIYGNYFSEQGNQREAYGTRLPTAGLLEKG
eukprot:c12087_g1_i1 orf=73-246(+)